MSRLDRPCLPIKRHDTGGIEKSKAGVCSALADVGGLPVNGSDDGFERECPRLLGHRIFCLIFNLETVRVFLALRNICTAVINCCAKKRIGLGSSDFAE